MFSGVFDHGCGKDRTTRHGQEPDQGRKEGQPELFPAQGDGQLLHEPLALACGLQELAQNHDQIDDDEQQHELRVDERGQAHPGPLNRAVAEEQGHPQAAQKDGQPDPQLESQEDEHQAQGGQDLEDRNQKGDVHEACFFLDEC